MIISEYTRKELGAEAIRLKHSISEERKRLGQKRPQFNPGWNLRVMSHGASVVIIERLALGSTTHSMAL